MTEQDEQQRNLSIEEAALYIGGRDFPVQTLRNLVRRKKIGFVRIGRELAFKREQLDAYVEAHTVQAVSNPWGLTDSAARDLRAGRARAKRAS